MNAGTVLPAFSPSNFTPGAPINNPYYPLVPGTVFHAAANVTDPDTGAHAFETSQDIVTNRLDNVGGVQARAVHALTWHDGILIEDTTDWFAQDKSGNVWYLGEATKSFTYDDSGHLTGTDTQGSWKTGVNGAKPGYIMPANPTVGFRYYQEFSPADGAEDQAMITSLDRSTTVPAGSFTHVLETLEMSALEPGVRESKLYAPGIGIILTNDMLNANGVPLNAIPLVSITTAVPVPAAFWTGLLTMLLIVVPTGVRLAWANRHAVAIAAA